MITLRAKTTKWLRLGIVLLVGLHATSGRASAQDANKDLRAAMVDPVDMPLYTIHMGPEFTSTWVFGLADTPAIPAGFFGAGSDPWSGTIACVGSPFEASETPTADLVVRHERVEWIPNPETRYGPREIPKKFTLRCDMVKLSERATAPISVTYNGGQRQELWKVDVGMARNHPGGGRIEIKHINSDGNGGLADIEIAVKVLFTFIPPTGGKPLELESKVEWLSETNHSFLRWVDEETLSKFYISKEMQGNFVPATTRLDGKVVMKAGASCNATVKHSFVLPPKKDEIKGPWGTLEAIKQFPARKD